MRAFVLSLFVTSLLSPPAFAQAQPTPVGKQQKAAPETKKSRDQKAKAERQRPSRPVVQDPRQQPSTIDARKVRQNRQSTYPQTVPQSSTARPIRPQKPTIVQRPNAVTVPQYPVQTRPQVARPDRYYTRPIQPPRGARPNVQAPRPYTTQRVVTPQWHHNWRTDRRYDWRNYRNRNHTTYRLNRYYDPYGWNYRRYSVGWRLWPIFYDRNYWITDPYRYRLPQVPWPLQWVRYYNDVLLVNTMSGQIQDVIYGVFW